MPLYEIQYSFPLTRQHKTELASQITRLHATAFTTPSLFVNVNFTDVDASAESYFIAGKPRPNGCNRITGMVRTSDKRTKNDFDTLAEKIEDIWNQVVRRIEPHLEEDAKGGEGSKKEKNKKKGQPEETEKGREAKRLHAIFLYPMVAARESGIVIPTVSQHEISTTYAHDVLLKVGGMDSLLVACALFAACDSFFCRIRY
jgi:phenylpyruvate tautomerase PptA (4-oxalocrotonate tautomerase family)